MDINYKYDGICSTCESSPACVYPANKNQKILLCEEFNSESKKTPDKEIPTRINSENKSAANVNGKYKGLCRDCENRESCVYPKNEAGIWHCEEYK